MLAHTYISKSAGFSLDDSVCFHYWKYFGGGLPLVIMLMTIIKYCFLSINMYLSTISSFQETFWSYLGLISLSVCISFRHFLKRRYIRSTHSRALAFIQNDSFFQLCVICWESPLMCTSRSLKWICRLCLLETRNHEAEIPCNSNLYNFISFQPA